MKRYRVLLTAVAAVAVLAAVYLLAGRDTPSGEEPAAEAVSEGESRDDQPVGLLDFDPRTFDELTVSRSDEEFTLVPAGSSGYVLKGRPDIPLQPGVGETMGTVLSVLTAKEAVSAGDEDERHLFGLLEPEAVCSVSAGGSSTVLYLGGSNPDGSGRYLMREGDPRIYLIDAAAVGYVFPQLYDIRITRMNPVSLRELEKVSVSQGGRQIYRIELSDSSSPFASGMFPLAFTAPYDPPRGVFDSKYLELLAPIGEGVNILAFIDEPGPLASYGLDAASAREFTVEAGDGTGLSLQLGAEYGADGRYALVSRTSSPVLVIPQEAAAAAYIEPFDYMDSFAALVGIDTISGYRLDIRDLVIEARIERSGTEDGEGDTYLINGSEIGEERFKEFYQVLIGRSIDGEAERSAAAAEEPVMQLVYFHRTEEGQEKLVELYPYDDDFLMLQVDGGDRKFLMGRYQLNYLYDKGRELAAELD